jgi:hypothetical protein
MSRTLFLLLRNKERPPHPIEIAPTPVVYGNRIYKLRKKKMMMVHKKEEDEK